MTVENRLMQLEEAEIPYNITLIATEKQYPTKVLALYADGVEFELPITTENLRLLNQVDQKWYPPKTVELHRKEHEERYSKQNKEKGKEFNESYYLPEVFPILCLELDEPDISLLRDNLPIGEGNDEYWSHHVLQVRPHLLHAHGSPLCYTFMMPSVEIFEILEKARVSQQPNSPRKTKRKERRNRT